MAQQLDAGLTMVDGILGRSVSTCIPNKLESLRGKRIVFACQDKNLVPLEGWGMIRGTSYDATVVTLRQILDPTTIAAIDSSSVKLADTEEGVVYAVKCGVALTHAGKPLVHFRIGPVLFYLNETTLNQSIVSERILKLLLFDAEFASRFIRIRAERALQSELARTISNSIVLVDGSLRSTYFESATCGLKQIAEDCLLNGNLLIGLSKSTKFKIIERISSSLAKVRGPAYVDVTPTVRGLVKGAIGDNLMVNLSNQRLPALRADVIGDVQESLGRVIGNDQINNGYPDSLRLAHHISTFSTSEIMCLRSHIINNYGVTELPSEDLRAFLLGSV